MLDFTVSLSKAATGPVTVRYGTANGTAIQGPGGRPGSLLIGFDYLRPYWSYRDFTLAAPVQTLRKVSYDLSLSLPLELADGSTMTALEIQWELFDLARKYAEDRGLEAVGPPEVGQDLLRRWEAVLSGLETDPMSLATQSSWCANDPGSVSRPVSTPLRSTKCNDRSGVKRPLAA